MRRSARPIRSHRPANTASMHTYRHAHAGSWCQGWFDFFPEAPLGVLKIVESLLDIHDTELLAHFRAHDVSSEVCLWQLIFSLFWFA